MNKEARTPTVIGVNLTPQSGLEDQNDYQLAIRALTGALDDAGLERSDIDGLIAAGHPLYGTIKVQQLARLVGVNPAYTGAMDYNAGPFVVQQASALIAAGVCEIVACTYGANPGDGVGKPSGYDWVMDADHGYLNVNGITGMQWADYLLRYEPSDELLGHLAIAARENASLHPLAPPVEALTMDEYLEQDYVFWPLRAADLALNNAGGAALILSSAERAEDLTESPVYVRGWGRSETPGMFETSGHLQGVAMADAASRVFTAAGLEPEDIDVLGVSDATTVAIVQTLEGYGFCEPGGADEFVTSGATRLDGELPINPDGGHLAGGYLIGWAQQVELVEQLRGSAGDRQVPDAHFALHAATGGARERYLGLVYSDE